VTNVKDTLRGVPLNQYIYFWRSCKELHLQTFTITSTVDASLLLWTLRRAPLSDKLAIPALIFAKVARVKCRYCVNQHIHIKSSAVMYPLVALISARLFFELGLHLPASQS